jgi:di/tricarboxylate transporter
MLDKMKVIPQKVAFAIGLSLLLISPLLLFLLSELFPFNMWIGMIIEGLVFGIATLFILSAADKKHSRMDKKE